MTSEDISIALYTGAHKRTLRLEIRSANGLETFRQALTAMAAGKTEQIYFNELRGVGSLKGVRLYLGLSSEDPTMTVGWLMSGHDAKRGREGMCIWRRSMAGWQTCLELAARLSPGHHQYLAVEGDTVEIEVSYVEREDLGSADLPSND